MCRILSLLNPANISRKLIEAHDLAKATVSTDSSNQSRPFYRTGFETKYDFPQVECKSAVTNEAASRPAPSQAHPNQVRQDGIQNRFSSGLHDSDLDSDSGGAGEDVRGAELSSTRPVDAELGRTASPLGGSNAEADAAGPRENCPRTGSTTFKPEASG